MNNGSKYTISRGTSRILGATPEKDGVNFAIWCRDAKIMELLLFKNVDDTDPEVIELTGDIYRSAYYWHVKVYGIKDGQIYAWRIKKIVRARPGICFDPQKVLLDPYGKRILFPKKYNRTFSQFVGSNVAFCPRNAVVDMHKYDWDSDELPRIPLRQNVIYEMHVAGFTKGAGNDVPEKYKGTYLGVIDKIPYLKSLGINAVELLPVFQFDKYDALPGKINYWGYSPMSFFALHGDYSAEQGIYEPLDEFRDMVKALHKAGIEVLLDVVYNHTSEGGNTGPIYCFKGLDNTAYYLLDQKNEYRNYSGCGNTINASNPVAKRLITDSLRFWAKEMHVDGFRFDLACVLSRDQNGNPQTDPPTTLAIDTDYSLSDVKLIAEPWDVGGLYQVGGMAGNKWREWNGQFRDDIRCFMRGDNGIIRRFCNRLLGSPDIYTNIVMDPQKSINFITCHDGFTLWDLVSYNERHNDANGEHGKDGNSVNFSSNYGVEGETDDKEINQLRLRQCKNFMLLNLFSMGTPMILMGDETLRTQKGNNNAYCQDNKYSWLDWEVSGRKAEMLNFTKKLITYRTARGENLDYFGDYVESLQDAIRANMVKWHGIEPFKPDFSISSHSIGVSIYSGSNHAYMYMYVNAFWNGLHLVIPTLGNSKNWYRIADTSLLPPNDIYARTEKPVKVWHNYYLGPRSVLILISPEEITDSKTDAEQKIVI